jgi:thiol-disulfide isomerase/thioredoxin
LESSPTRVHCPFCSATAPALNRFDEEYRGRGLVVIGVYHHKDPESLDVETVRGYVEHYQFRFPVAVDPDWQTLKRGSTATSARGRASASSSIGTV